MLLVEYYSVLKIINLFIKQSGSISKMLKERTSIVEERSQNKEIKSTYYMISYLYIYQIYIYIYFHVKKNQNSGCCWEMGIGRWHERNFWSFENVVYFNFGMVAYHTKPYHTIPTMVWLHTNFGMVAWWNIYVLKLTKLYFYNLCLSWAYKFYFRNTHLTNFKVLGYCGENEF